MSESDKYAGFLNDVKDTYGKSMCAYWVFPNVVLTLSGARAYCDLVLWGDNFKQHKLWQKDIDKCLNILEKHISLLIGDINQKIVNGDSFTVVDIVTNTGFDSIKNSKFVTNFPTDYKTKLNNLDDLFNLISKYLSKDIKDKFNDENLNHIVHGLVLGYPDQAILGAVEYWQVEDANKINKLQPKIISANIEGADYYFGPQPVYDLSQEDISNPEIVKNEKLWSIILKSFYASKLHTELANSKEFQAKISELSQ